MTIISNSLQVIQTNILQAKNRVNRQDNVKLLAVSKTQGAERLREAYRAGQTVFGENYVQEAIVKQNLLGDCNIEWHFIGPIQSNKTQLIAQHFTWVQSVDRLKIAQRLSKARDITLPPLNICIQINSSNEASKSGIQSQELIDLATEITKLPNLKLRGLMAIPAPTSDVAKQRQQFKVVREAFMLLQQNGFDIDTLSIGMSDDYVAAIEEGATIVRIGSAIFGARTPVKNDE
ncbi:MAG: YggS family pyridoxal phosphate-dependent enzyme [Betaproteobacteria bacterium]|nr:YggS family pyridoxal phosphate-dependent enzyme [Betaproteobacteria bacterium]MCH9849308.1 YggS family pyridoxal phosphate-dependent enzyme [Betaproteobacteria bacterium]MDG1097111.1 YggS family pyridoxal phosphate-dependent enzyme [Methylophilaceae bacterium]